jgi:hypothetical protein
MQDLIFGWVVEFFSVFFGWQKTSGALHPTEKLKSLAELSKEVLK